MTNIERNKAVVAQLYSEAMNKRHLLILNDLISPEYIGVNGSKGPEGFQFPIMSLVKGFPDIQWNVQTIIAEGDNVFVHWKVVGTHLQQFQQHAPTGKKIVSDGMGIYELKDGKVVKTTVQTDRLGLLQQLEVVPEDLSTLRRRTGNEVNFIDRFSVPAAAREEFMARVAANRKYIRTLPGFIEDASYEHVDEHGDIVMITVATWENEDSVRKAKEAVHAEYKRQDFDMAAMFARLHITMDRALFQRAR